MRPPVPPVGGPRAFGNSTAPRPYGAEKAPLALQPRASPRWLSASPLQRISALFRPRSTWFLKLPTPVTTASASAHLRTTLPWYAWLVLGGLELLGKFGLPTRTLAAALEQRWGPAGQERALILGKMSAEASPLDAYRRARQCGYDPSTALGYLLQQIHDGRPLHSHGRWAFTIGTIDALRREGIEPEMCFHQMELVARSLGVPVDPHLRKLQRDLEWRQSALQEVSPGMLDWSLTTTGERFREAIQARPTHDATHPPMDATAWQLGRALLERAQQPEMRVLRMVIGLASQHRGERVGVVLPPANRFSLTWGFERIGHGNQLRVNAPANYYIGPFSFRAGEVIVVDADHHVHTTPALFLIDRHGRPHFVTREDYDHVMGIAAYYRDNAPSGGPEFRQAFFRFVNQLQAVWKFTFPGTPVLAGSPRAIAKQVQLLKRMHWATQLIAELADLLRDVPLLKPYPLLLGQRIAALGGDYAARFDPERRAQFVRALGYLEQDILRGTSPLGLYTEALTSLTYNAARGRLSRDVSPVWMGMPSPHFADDLRFWLRMESPPVAERLPPADQKYLRRFVSRMTRSTPGPSLDRATAYLAARSIDRAFVEYEGVIADPRQPLDARMTAAERLALEAATHREWAISEFAVQELIRFVEAGIALPESTRKVLHSLCQQQDAAQHPRTLSQALHRLLTPRARQDATAHRHPLGLLRLVQESDQNA